VDRLSRRPPAGNYGSRWSSRSTSRYPPSRRRCRGCRRAEPTRRGRSGCHCRAARGIYLDGPDPSILQVGAQKGVRPCPNDGGLHGHSLHASSAPAHGEVTLTTPFVEANGGDLTTCVVTNIDSSKAITVTVELIDVDGSTIDAVNGGPIPPATLAARAGCE